MATTPCKLPTSSDKWRYTLWTTLVFLIIINSYTYKITQRLFSGILGQIANPTTGIPTTTGIALHTVVFTLIVRYMMDFDI